MTVEGGVASPEDAPTGKEMEPVGNGHTVEGSKRKQLPALNQEGSGVINPSREISLANPGQFLPSPARQLPEQLGSDGAGAGSSSKGRRDSVLSQGRRESLIPTTDGSCELPRTNDLYSPSPLSLSLVLLRTLWASRRLSHR